jgi:hypothetical protein
MWPSNIPFQSLPDIHLRFSGDDRITAFPLNSREFYTIMSPMKERIGPVIKFFDKTSVAAVKLDFGDLSIGDTIRAKGHEIDFTQKIEVMEFDRHSVEKASCGQFTGIRVLQPAKPFDLVYKVTG